MSRVPGRAEFCRLVKRAGLTTTTAFLNNSRTLAQRSHRSAGDKSCWTVHLPSVELCRAVTSLPGSPPSPLLFPPAKRHWVSAVSPKPALLLSTTPSSYSHPSALSSFVPRFTFAFCRHHTPASPQAFRLPLPCSPSNPTSTSSHGTRKVDPAALHRLIHLVLSFVRHERFLILPIEGPIPTRLPHILSSIDSRASAT